MIIQIYCITSLLFSCHKSTEILVCMKILVLHVGSDINYCVYWVGKIFKEVNIFI